MSRSDTLTTLRAPRQGRRIGAGPTGAETVPAAIGEALG
ncbi:hypothetical protein BX257_0431 [Streptomyces sp. 3212.3]|nr:hypothetical protein BX257_0431 [Streptomyces sp. 3212.3]